MSAEPRFAPAGWPQLEPTTVIMGSGPSLSRAQLDAVRGAAAAGGVSAIAINDVGLIARWADLWYAADEPFWRRYRVQAAAHPAVRVSGDAWPVEQGIAHLRLNCHLDATPQTRAYVPGHVLSGLHSGFQALQLAVSLGATRVLLLGYDCRAVNGADNYFGPKVVNAHIKSPYGWWAKFYRQLKLPTGVEVVNCTPGSAIDAYPAEDLGRALVWGCG